MLLSLINVRLKTEEKREPKRKFDALQFLMECPPFLSERQAGDRS
jgi:hypothetical protein